MQFSNSLHRLVQRIRLRALQRVSAEQFGKGVHRDRVHSAQYGLQSIAPAIYAQRARKDLH